ncbi:MAG: serine/threonine protein kinase [Planctomycetes bacterium]|nr:serine/threonine protein kinase [Planctomycetota bacterium]
MSREPSPSAKHAVGQSHDGFTLLELVAEGPFSEVWRAQGRTEVAAVKFARGEVGAQMLAEEARVLADLRDRQRTAQNLSPEASPFRRGQEVAVGALYSGSARGDERADFLATLWIPGGSFRSRLERLKGPDDRARAVALFCDLVRAVGLVHAAGVVHGDLKPANVLIDEERPLLVDFGLARHLREARLERSLKQSLQSQDALTGGTMAYMAPEIVKGGEPTTAGDVYALGVILHEVLVGRRPSKVTTPSELKKTVPEALIPILLKALAYEPTERYANADDFAWHLDQEREALTATGVSRRARSFARFALGGLAAFFVALRYVSVVTLLSAYVGICVGTIGLVVLEGPSGLFALITFVPIGILHAVIRWEGPESSEEAAARHSGQVVSRQLSDF